ncbi:hypothetical protein LDFHOB_09665 [Candidatus Electronema aureum]
MGRDAHSPSLLKPEWTVPVIGIKLNLKGFFEKVLARQSQKGRQGA